MVLLLLIFFQIQGPGWSVKIEPIQYEYYVKEPMWFLIEAKNETERNLKDLSKEGFIELDGGYCRKPVVSSMLVDNTMEMKKEGGDVVFPPGKIRRISFLLNNLCYDTFAPVWWKNDEVDEFYGVHNLCYVKKYREYSREKNEWEEKEERLCAEFKVIYPPEGEERDAYNKYLKKEINDVSELNYEEAVDFIKEYPSSRYAGWLFDKFYPEFANKEAERFLDEIKKPMEEREIYKRFKDIYPGKENFQKMIKVYAEGGEKFLKRHKNHPLDSLIKAVLAYEFIYLGDYKKGINYGRMALQDPYPRWYKYFIYNQKDDVAKYQRENLEKIIKEIENLKK